MSYYVNFQCG